MAVDKFGGHNLDTLPNHRFKLVKAIDNITIYKMAVDKMAVDKIGGHHLDTLPNHLFKWVKAIDKMTVYMKWL